MFSVCWSLTPLVALINNKLEMRIDAIKLGYFCNRTFCVNAVGIEAFGNIINFVA